MENQKEFNKEMEKEVSRLISPEDIEKITEDAEQIVERMKPAGQDDLAAIMDQLGNLGAKEQQRAGESLGSLRKPVKELLKNSNNTEIPDTLLKLRSELNDINPEALRASGVKGMINRILRKNSLDKYIAKYDTVEKNIEAIIKNLLRGQDKLEEDNADLEIIKRDSQEKIYHMEKQIFLGKKLFDILEKKKTDPDWHTKENIIMEAQQKVIVRTRNMSTAVNVLHQSIAGINVIKKNNEDLKEAIRNAIYTTKNIGTVTVAIHMALENQKSVIKAVKTVNEATENMLLANSRALKENTEETSKLLEDPAMSFEKAKEAFNNIYSAVETQEQSSRRIIENSKKYLDQMEELNKEIKEKSKDK